VLRGEKVRVIGAIVISNEEIEWCKQRKLIKKFSGSLERRNVNGFMSVQNISKAYDEGGP
jgi:hypothetical protein